MSRQITPTMLRKKQEALRAAIQQAGRDDAQRASEGIVELKQGELALAPPLGRIGDALVW